MLFEMLASLCNTAIVAIILWAACPSVVAIANDCDRQLFSGTSQSGLRFNPVDSSKAPFLSSTLRQLPEFRKTLESKGLVLAELEFVSQMMQESPILMEFHGGAMSLGHRLAPSSFLDLSQWARTKFYLVPVRNKLTKVKMNDVVIRFEQKKLFSPQGTILPFQIHSASVSVHIVSPQGIADLLTEGVEPWSKNFYFDSNEVVFLESVVNAQEMTGEGPQKRFIPFLNREWVSGPLKEWIQNCAKEQGEGCQDRNVSIVWNHARIDVEGDSPNNSPNNLLPDMAPNGRTLNELIAELMKVVHYEGESFKIVKIERSFDDKRGNHHHRIPLLPTRILLRLSWKQILGLTFFLRNYPVKLY